MIVLFLSSLIPEFKVVELIFLRESMKRNINNSFCLWSLFLRCSFSSKRALPIWIRMVIGDFGNGETGGKQEGPEMGYGRCRRHSGGRV